MFHNIPQELQALPQWVCWRYEEVSGRRTKVPYAPGGLHKANVHNPATWGTFAAAVQGSMHPSFDGIGFMLTENDPYTGIDIDDKLESPASDKERAVHQRILDSFISYTERSVGGRGYHIIIRGKIPGGRGRDRGHVGVYSTQRYLTFSGVVVRNAPITECQALLEALVGQMPAPGADDDLYDIEGVLDDDEVHEMALRASNGEKYDALCKGDWQGMGYTSHSEADLALLSILAFYTRDNDQVRRLFRYSALGRREKAQQDDRYLNTNLRKIRSSEPTPTDYALAEVSARNILQNAVVPPAPPVPPIDVAALENVVPTVREQHAVGEGTEGQEGIGAQHAGDISLPPGLVGELAAYLYGAAVRPVPEIALCTAIGFLAGIVGRSYNISGTGLNHYMLFVGKTGAGKEGMATGINKLVSCVQPMVPMASEFVGPSAFASGQGLIRTLDKKPCFVSVLGEFGLTLQALSDPRAPAAQVILRKVLLDLYGKSGWESMLHSTAYSDIEKNTKTIHAPAVTILGETTPETFFDGINGNDIADGLIPRFHVVEYRGPRPARNPNSGQPPAQPLLQRIADMLAVAVTTQQNRTCSGVAIDAQALTLLDKFDTQCDAHINGAGNAGEAQLWNRAHLKALKLAGLLAVGCNPHQPVVTAAVAQWAIDFTSRGTANLLKRFFDGQVGRGDMRQISDLKLIIADYFKLDAKGRKTYRVEKDWQAKGLVPCGYMQIRVGNCASFYHDRNGATRALKTALENLVDDGMLVKLTPQDTFKHAGTRRTMYALAEGWSH